MRRCDCPRRATIHRSSSEFGCSIRFASHCLAQDVWSSPFLSYGIDIWLATTALAGLSGSITFIGWEAKNLAQGSDFDYNDLIFAFANTSTTTDVPDPLTLSLFGAGLAGAAWVGRRRSKKTKA